METAGLEPATLYMQNIRTTNCAMFPRMFFINFGTLFFEMFINKGNNGIRTHGTLSIRTTN